MKKASEKGFVFIRIQFQKESRLHSENFLNKQKKYQISQSLPSRISLKAGKSMFPLLQIRDLCDRYTPNYFICVFQKKLKLNVRSRALSLKKH